MEKKAVHKDLPFEKAFDRLEAILGMLNSGSCTLEDSLTLYQEADELILHCHNKLIHAEKTVDVLIKNRENKLLVENNTPKTEPFEPGTL